MLLYSSIPIYEDNSNNRSSVYKVTSKLTAYRVVVTNDEVVVFGPGVSYTLDITDSGTIDGEPCLSRALSNEAKAVMAVMLLEEEE